VSAEAQPSSTSGLPPEGVIAALTRRALWRVINAHDGFVGWVAASTECYAALRPNKFEQRLFCLQLDRAEYEIERGSPPEFQEADAASNDYFTDARFVERQLNNAPIAGDSADDMREKEDDLVVLDTAMAVAREEMGRRLRANAAPQPPAGSPTPCKISVCKT
jgi:hypothetical protein